MQSQARPLQGSRILFVVGQHFPYHRMGKSAAGEGGGDLVALTGGELGGVLPLHKRTGRLQLWLSPSSCLGKQLLHHIGGGVAVNALGRKIVQNLAAGLALAQQLRGAAAGKRDIV